MDAAPVGVVGEVSIIHLFIHLFIHLLTDKFASWLIIYLI